MKYLLLIAILLPVTASSAQTIVSNKQQREDAAGFREFADRVQKYVQLHASVAANLQRIKRADSPENIDIHQQELARGIREARRKVHRGDIFRPDTTEAIRHAIRSVFQSTKADHARATIEQGPPLTERHLKVNQQFPESVAYSTVPPTLLLALPPLPDGLAYRIVGHDLYLLDVTAEMVVDFIPRAIP